MSNWTYSTWRASLRRDGELFAIVTPDGRNNLPDSQVQELVGKLNLAESFIDVLPEALDLAEKQGKDELADKLRAALQAHAKLEDGEAWGSR